MEQYTQLMRERVTLWETGFTRSWTGVLNGHENMTKKGRMTADTVVPTIRCSPHAQSTSHDRHPTAESGLREWDGGRTLYPTERCSPAMRRRNHTLDIARASRTAPMPIRLTDSLDTSMSHPKKVMPAIDVAVAIAV